MQLTAAVSTSVQAKSGIRRNNMQFQANEERFLFDNEGAYIPS